MLFIQDEHQQTSQRKTKQPLPCPNANDSTIRQEVLTPQATLKIFWNYGVKQPFSQYQKHGRNTM